MKIVLDAFDHALLDALMRDSTLTNAALSERVKLSPSQCSRRRARLETAGIISGYGARINRKALGYGLRAVTRVNLKTHNEETAERFHRFLSASDEIESAYSVSGDADYVLMILTKDLAHFAEFIHGEVLPHPNVHQVRSEIVLMPIKEA